MKTGWFLRALAGLVIAAAGLALALFAGAPLAAALLALLGGAIAMLAAWPQASDESVPPRAMEVQGPLLLPAAADALEPFDDPVLVVRARRVRFANKAARSLLGEHIEGVDVRLALRHPAAAERLMDRASSEPAEKVTRTELVGLGARERRWEMTVWPLADGARLVRLADRSEAHASEQMRTDFVANASHELRTPLATLLGYLETLMGDSAPADAKIRSRFLRIMFDEAGRMHRLVDELISLSRIEAERFTPLRDAVALLPLAEEIRDECRATAEARGTGIEIVPAIADPLVPGDRRQLAQMLRNLVTNAISYGRADSIVTIRFEAAGPEMLRLSVEDQGDGIAAEHLPRLTERFYRVDPGRSRALGGTGLGLAIVKHIVGRHRGRLDIESRVGEGTIVHVYLPLAPERLSSNRHDPVTQGTRDPATDASGVESDDGG